MEFYLTDGETGTLFSDKQLQFFADYVMKPVLDRIATLEHNIADLLAELKDDNRGYVPRREIQSFIEGSQKDRAALWKALWGVLILFVALGFSVLLNYLQIHSVMHP